VTRARKAVGKTQTPACSLAALTLAFADDPEVTVPAPKRGAFGTNALKVRGRIFAMEVNEAVVLKLPRARVEALIASGEGTAFRTGADRVMREWVVLSRTTRDALALAREARCFVAP
jgi:hypothetical protein